MHFEKFVYESFTISVEIRACLVLSLVLSLVMSLNRHQTCRISLQRGLYP